MRNTIRKVIMVVAVLTTSCQVSEKWKKGPRMAHIRMLSRASRKAQGEPAAWQSHWAKARNLARKPRPAPRCGSRVEAVLVSCFFNRTETSENNDYAGMTLRQWGGRPLGGNEGNYE